jgi:hypothetical protein
LESVTSKQPLSRSVNEKCRLREYGSYNTDKE